MSLEETFHFTTTDKHITLEALEIKSSFHDNNDFTRHLLSRPDVVPLTRVNHEQLDSSVSSVFAFNVT